MRGVGVPIISAPSFQIGSDPDPDIAKSLWEWDPSSLNKRAARDELCLPIGTYPGSLPKWHQLQGTDDYVTGNSI